MLYCNKCKGRVYIKVRVPGLMSYTAVINTDKFKLFPNLLVEDNLKDQIEIDSFYCQGCDLSFDRDSVFILFTSSQYTGKFFKVEDSCIVSILCSDEERDGNKINLVCPPRIIGKSEVAAYNRDFNPYKDDKYLFVKDLDKIELCF